MCDSPLTAELSNGKFDGSVTLHPLTRTTVKPEDKIEDDSILFKSIPAKNDLRRVIECVSTALVDPTKESYGLKGTTRFSFSKISFDPKGVRWDGTVDYDVKTESGSQMTGSFPIELQCFKVSQSIDLSYTNFVAVDITYSLGRRRHEMNKDVLDSRHKAFDLIKYNLTKELYKLYLPTEFPEGCKGKTFRSIYQLNSKIKSGSFATVCIGTHRASRKRVAIKCTLRNKIKPYDDAVVYSEVGILMTLRHKYICPITDFFVQDDCYFMVLEYMDGGDLFDRLGKKRTYNENDARDLCMKLLEAVAFLHDNKIAHCDLKHNNLLLASKEDDSHIKIADFGFAARVYAPNCLSDQCGTPYFVAPEIILRSPFGEKSDMWSVGVIMYCLLCGHVPFNGRRNVDLFRAVVNCKYTFGPEWDGVSSHAKNLIKRLLVTDPSARISAREALQSEWINHDSDELALHMLEATSRELGVFNARQKLKSIILTTQCAMAIQSFGVRKKRNLLVKREDIPDEDLDVDYSSDAN